jgi:ribosomal protein S18 acetylase RimI-like enzyme
MQFDLIVRPTTAEDLPGISTVAEITGLFPASMLPDMISGHLANEADQIWLTAMLNGSVVGFVFCEPERLANATWNMRAIGVAPDFQGKGVASKLTVALENALLERHGRILVVETTSDDDQIRARGFYAAKGYQEEATIREFWDSGVDKVVFWKKLRST